MPHVTPFIAGVLLTTVSNAAQHTEKPGYLRLTGKIDRPDAVRISGKDVERFTRVSGDTPQQHYPVAARRADLKGTVVVDLLLNDVGRVLEAQVVSEAPPGKGFGVAALDTAKTFEFDNPLQKLVLMSVTMEFLP